MAIQQVPKVVAKAVLKRYASRFTQQPRYVQQAYMSGLKRWAWVQPVWDEVYQELFPPDPIAAEDEAAIAIANAGTLPLAAGVQTFDSAYARYRCVEVDPLRCLAQPATVDGNQAKQCQTCGFPTLLPAKAMLQGARGTYRVEQWLGRRGIGRTYAGVQASTNEPILIKEYLLPALYFNAEQSWQIKQLFKNLAGLSLADGRSQDVRLLAPLEAIVDDSAARCYLVLDERSLSPTLNQHLAAGRLSEVQVRRVLQQVLQTLEFLYGQKFRLGAGQLRTGLVHGNLNLDSLLIGQAEAETLNQVPTTEAAIANQERDANFFVFLSDLAVWERLFDPPLAKTFIPSVSKDLSALGYIAFYLLAGNVITDAEKPLDPLQERHWQCSDRPLKQFILRLMGLVDVPFESAETARRALLQLPIAKAAVAPEPDIVTTIAPTPKLPRWFVLLLSAIGCGLLVWLVWSLLAKPQLSTATRKAPPINALKDVSGMPPGTFTYTATQDGIWSYVWQTPDLIQKGQTLEQRLTAAQPKLQLQFQPAVSSEAAIARVQDGTVAFAIVPLIQPLPEGLAAEPIAYDGLAVFVAFSYAQRQAGLPTHLNGQLSLEQLRQLYTGNVANWQAFSRSTLAVKLYEPTNREAQAVFQQRVMQTADRSNASDTLNRLIPLPEFDIMRSVIRDFEANQIGSIGFSSLSKIVGQCSVYPLALQAKNSQPQQALGFNQGRSITPTTNLCNEKGSYRLKPELLRTGQYPLSYPLAIVYAKDNDRPAIGSKFAALLKTREGQTLLSQTGLVPLDDK